NTIYAGTSFFRVRAVSASSLNASGGVFKSTDGGKTWNLLGNDWFAFKWVTKIVVHPTNPDLVYVAVGGPTTGYRSGAGVWKSTDGGQTWTNTTTSLTPNASFTPAFTDLVMAPTDPMTLYTAIGDVAGAPENAVYKSSDGGASWTRAGNFPTGAQNGLT